MAIQPVNDYLLLRPIKAEEKTPGGIVVPDSAKVPGSGKLQRGLVISVSDELLDDWDEEDFKGRVVYFKAGTGVEVTGAVDDDMPDDLEDLLFVSADDLFAVAPAPVVAAK